MGGFGAGSPQQGLPDGRYMCKPVSNVSQADDLTFWTEGRSVLKLTEPDELLRRRMFRFPLARSGTNVADIATHVHLSDFPSTVPPLSVFGPPAYDTR